MHFEWDATKAASNYAKHGISFEQATEVWDRRVIVFDVAHPTESRWMALGLVGADVVAVVYTMRGDVTRIISARFASRQERRRYDATE
jgi:uncharacterized DUF497 family protein